MMMTLFCTLAECDAREAKERDTIYMLTFKWPMNSRFSHLINLRGGNESSKNLCVDKSTRFRIIFVILCYFLLS